MRDESGERRRRRGSSWTGGEGAQLARVTHRVRQGCTNETEKQAAAGAEGQEEERGTENASGETAAT